MTLPTQDQYYKEIFMAIAQINKVPMDALGADGKPFKHFTIKKHLRNIFIRAKKRAEILEDYHYYLSFEDTKNLIVTKRILKEQEEKLTRSLEAVKQSIRDIRVHAKVVIPFLKKLRGSLDLDKKEEDGK